MTIWEGTVAALATKIYKKNYRLLSLPRLAMHIVMLVQEYSTAQHTYDFSLLSCYTTISCCLPDTWRYQDTLTRILWSSLFCQINGVDDGCQNQYLHNSQKLLVHIRMTNHIIRVSKSKENHSHIISFTHPMFCALGFKIMCAGELHVVPSLPSVSLHSLTSSWCFS